MAYAYFKPDGTIQTISSKRSLYSDETIIELEVPDLTHPNAIYLDLETTTVCDRMAFHLEISFNSVKGVPLGTVATLPAGQFTITDGEMEFDADVRETVWMHLDHPHYVAQYISIPTGPEAT